MTIEFSLDRFFEKSSIIKFYENPSSRVRVVTCGRTDRRIEVTKLIVAFRNFAKAPKNGYTEAASVNFVTFFKTATSKGISSCYSLPVYKKGVRRPLTALDSLVQSGYTAAMVVLEEMRTKQIV
jgi:hypothetical protein